MSDLIVRGTDWKDGSIYDVVEIRRNGDVFNRSLFERYSAEIDALFDKLIYG